MLDFGSHLLPRNEREVEVWEGFPALRLQLRSPLLLAAAASEPGKYQAFDSLPHWQVMLPPGRACAQCGCEIVSKASSLSVSLHPLLEASPDQAGSSCKETSQPCPVWAPEGRRGSVLDRLRFWGHTGLASWGLCVPSSRQRPDEAVGCLRANLGKRGRVKT